MTKPPTSEDSTSSLRALDPVDRATQCELVLDGALERDKFAQRRAARWQQHDDGA